MFSGSKEQCHQARASCFGGVKSYKSSVYITCINSNMIQLVSRSRQVEA